MPEPTSVPSAETEGTRVSAAMVLIAAERRRQIEGEGYSLEHDAEHGRHALALAAGEYASARWDWRWPGPFWPWEKSAFKPRGRARNLIRAGALYRAALDLPEPERAFWASERTEDLQRSLDRVTAELDALLNEVAELLGVTTPPGVQS